MFYLCFRFLGVYGLSKGFHISLYIYIYIFLVDLGSGRRLLGSNFLFSSVVFNVNPIKTNSNQSKSPWDLIRYVIYKLISMLIVGISSIVTAHSISPALRFTYSGMIPRDENAQKEACEHLKSLP